MTSDFAHEALLYAGDDAFLDGAMPFVREGLEADEADAARPDRGQARKHQGRAERRRRARLVRRHGRGRREPGADHSGMASVRGRVQRRRIGARNRRADLARPHAGRARRVPAARSAAQSRVRRRLVVPPPLPVRHDGARRCGHRGGRPQPSGRGRARRQTGERRVSRAARFRRPIRRAPSGPARDGAGARVRRRDAG